jgi:hypothetical protein
MGHMPCPSHSSCFDDSNTDLARIDIKTCHCSISSGLLLLDVGIPDLKGNRRVTFRWDRALAVVKVTSSYTRKTRSCNAGQTEVGFTWTISGRQPSQAKPSQAKVLTGRGDLREAQVDVPLSVSLSCNGPTFVWTFWGDSVRRAGALVFRVRCGLGSP